MDTYIIGKDAVKGKDVLSFKDIDVGELFIAIDDRIIFNGTERLLVRDATVYKKVHQKLDNKPEKIFWASAYTPNNEYIIDRDRFDRLVGTKGGFFIIDKSHTELFMKYHLYTSYFIDRVQDQNSI